MIDNKPGGQNTIGAQAAARSPADGYTFYFATTAALVTNAYLFKTLPYDPQKDFVPVAFVARSPFGLLVEAEFAAALAAGPSSTRPKAEPGQLTLGNEGPRTFSGMISRLMAARLKIERQPGALRIDRRWRTQNLLGGQVEAIVADLASTAGLIKRGQAAPARGEFGAARRRLRELCRRWPTGCPASTWSAGSPIVAPDRHAGGGGRSARTATSTPCWPTRTWPIASPRSDRLPMPAMGVEQVGAFLRAEHQRWADATREIGLLPE